MIIMVDNYREIKDHLPPTVRIVSISKTQPIKAIQELYDANIKVFGENRVQELVSKYEALPKDIQWHLVGQLQTNKVKFIAPFISLIHSVDSLKLLNEINLQALKYKRVIDCLLQFHIATEETKFGLDREEARSLLLSKEFARLKNVRIKGLMGMATFTDNYKLVRNEFRSLKSTFDDLKMEFFKNDEWFCELSMGMSGDFMIAAEEGSTLVRIGTAIFGNR